MRHSPRCSVHAAAAVQPEGQEEMAWGCRVAGSRKEKVSDLNFPEKESEGYPFQVHHVAWLGKEDDV